MKDIEATQQKITRVCSKLGIVEEHVRLPDSAQAAQPHVVDIVL